MSELRKQLSDEIFEPLSKVEALHLARVIANKAESEGVRNNAKNRLVCSNARWIFKLISKQVGSRLGLNDQETALFNSVMVDVKREMSKLAKDVTTANLRFSTVITRLVTSRLCDKIRREYAKKRIEPSRVGIEYAESIETENELEQIDLIELFHKTLEEELSDEEYIIIASIFGIGEFHVLTQGNLAEALGISPNRVQYLFARAKKKLKTALDD